MQVHTLLSPDLILLNLKATTVEEVLREISRFMEERGAIKNGKKLFQRLMAREKLGSTALPGGIAVPHCKMEELDSPILSLAISPQGVDFNSPDGKLTHIFFAAVSPISPPNLHLQVLAAIAKLARKGKKSLVEKLLNAKTPEMAYEIIRDEEIQEGNEE